MPDTDPYESDPRLGDLLDEALGPQTLPGGVPRDLADRVVAQTAGHLGPRRRVVAARIGRATAWALATAAVVALASGAALWISQQSPVKPQGPIAAAEQSIEEELELLALEIESLQTAGHWDTLRDELDEDISEWEWMLDEPEPTTIF